MSIKNTQLQNFYHFYQKQFKDWEQIYSHLQKKFTPIIRVRPQHFKQQIVLWKNSQKKYHQLEWYPLAYHWPAHVPYPTILPGVDLAYSYVMNASSLIPILALEPQAGDIVLDACAAPGGKALFIHDLLENKGVLVANDNSKSRYTRMNQLFRHYEVNLVDTHFGKAELLAQRYQNYFDKILLDTPCSSEKHLIQKPKYLKKWTPNRIKRLQKTQFNLLKQLFLTLKPGGKLVYSTCAVNVDENENVLQEFLENHSNAKLSSLQTLLVPKSPGFSQSQLKEKEKVIRIWPHIHDMDPMFVAAITKK